MPNEINTFLDQLTAQCDAYWRICPGGQGCGMSVLFGSKADLISEYPPAWSALTLSSLATTIGEETLKIVEQDCTHSKCGVLLGPYSKDKGLKVTFCLGNQRVVRQYPVALLKEENFFFAEAEPQQPK